MRLKKILYVGGSSFINRGVEKYIETTIQTLSSEPYAIDVLTPNKNCNNRMTELLRHRGTEIIELKCFRLPVIRELQFCYRLSKIIKQKQYDIVEAQTGNIEMMALTSWIAKKNGTKKVIVHTHNTHDKNLHYQIHKLLFNRLFRYADLCFACSYEAGVDSFPSNRASEVVVIPNSIDVEKYKFNPVYRNDYRQRNNIQPDTKVLVNVGALTEQKNQAYLMKVMKLLADQNVLLLIAGEGEKKEELERLVSMEGISDCVRLLGRVDDIPQLLAASDFFLLPSKWEGLGIVLVEAQASGLPCICSDVIVKEVEITEHITKLKVCQNEEEWASMIVQIPLNSERQSDNSLVNNSIFSLNHLRETLVRYYS